LKQDGGRAVLANVEGQDRSDSQDSEPGGMGGAGAASTSEFPGPEFTAGRHS